MVVHPIRKGPLIGERPRAPAARTVNQLRRMFYLRSGSLAACWKWASARGAKPTSLDVQMIIDPFGQTRDVSVISRDPLDSELVTCLRAALTPTEWLIDVQPRPTRLSATLSFVLADQPAWKKPPKQPTPPAPSSEPWRGTVCTLVLDDVPIEEIHLPFDLVVSDADDRRLATPGTARWDRCRDSARETDKRTIRMAVRSNMGALQACYADAIQRVPGLAGDVQVIALFGPRGAAPTATTTGAGDATLHACMTAAIAPLWLDTPTPAMLEVHSTFTFTLDPAPPPTRDPAALLAGGETDDAIAAWTSIIATPHAPIEACRARIGIARAMIELAPWLDDPRVLAAMTDLATFVLTLRGGSQSACLEDVKPLLSIYSQISAHDDPSASVVRPRRPERLAAILPLAPHLDWGPSLRWHHAEYLLTTSRKAEGRAILQELASDPTIGADVTERLERAKQVQSVNDRCLW